MSLPGAALRLIEAARNGAATSLSEPAVKTILSAAGIAVPSSTIIPALHGNHEISDAQVFPAVLKIVSGAITHKNAVGGVMVVQERGHLEQALVGMQASVKRRAPQAMIEGFLLEEMINGGLELLAGIKRDSRFGLLITLGLGGAWANALKGAVTALLPLDGAQARALVGRFFANADDQDSISALCSFLMTMGAIAEQFGDRLDVLEVNPVKLVNVNGKAAVVALDGVLTLCAPLLR